MKYIEPEALETKFTCPHCEAISQQNWWGIDWDQKKYSLSQSDIRISTCFQCNENTLWIEEKMYYPDNGSVLPPNPEMPTEVKNLYLEAASIQSKSPRGAAALLRLAIQILCKELGETGKDINNDIANLVKKGLPSIIQKSLDIVRVTGNEAVHPGQIDTDNKEVSEKLFKLVNIIIEYMIEMPNKINETYDGLPPNKVAAIKIRDQKTNPELAKKN